MKKVLTVLTALTLFLAGAYLVSGAGLIGTRSSTSGIVNRTTTAEAWFVPSAVTGNWEVTRYGTLSGRQINRSAVRLAEGNRTTGWVWSTTATNRNSNAVFRATTSLGNNILQVLDFNWDWRYFN